MAITGFIDAPGGTTLGMGDDQGNVVRDGGSISADEKGEKPLGGGALSVDSKDWTEVSFPIEVSGKSALYFSFDGEGSLDLKTVAFA